MIVAPLPDGEPRPCVSLASPAMAIARVQPLLTTRSVRGPFDYRLPASLAEVGVGSVLVVPFARRRVLGVVVDLAETQRARRRAAGRAAGGARGRRSPGAGRAGPLGGSRVLLDSRPRPGAGAAAGHRDRGRGPPRAAPDGAGGRGHARGTPGACGRGAARSPSAGGPAGARPGVPQRPVPGSLSGRRPGGAQAARAAGLGPHARARAPPRGSPSGCRRGRRCGRADPRAARGDRSHRRGLRELAGSAALARGDRLGQDRGLHGGGAHGARRGPRGDRARPRDRPDAADRGPLPPPFRRHRRPLALAAAGRGPLRRVAAPALGRGPDLRRPALGGVRAGLRSGVAGDRRGARLLLQAGGGPPV